MPPVLQYQVIASLGEFGDFEAFSGGGVQVQYSDYFEAGAQSPRKLEGTHTQAPVTLRRAYDPIRDKRLMDYILKFAQGMEGPRQLTLKFIAPNRVVVDSIVFPVCKPENLDVPPGQAGSSALSEISFTLQVESPTF